ncbi:MAG: sulfatase-like hydrolase/transferase, partial [Gemmatimonadaceae bacterium]|nr:sulfatase-like hydrolase/transferase [Chitinophagaceae bacterium]
LRDSKATLWEGGIRVPAFVRWPGKIREGQVTQQLAITMDWTATILAASGSSAGDIGKLDGVDLMSVLRGGTPVNNRTFYWKRYMGNKQNAAREGKWKYMKDDKDEYLFDLEADPGEKNNLRGSMTTVFESLKSKFKKWELEVGQ